MSGNLIAEPSSEETLTTTGRMEAEEKTAEQPQTSKNQSKKEAKLRLKESYKKSADVTQPRGMSADVTGSQYKKNASFGTILGQQYEVKTAALLYLRGLIQDGADFYLATNADGAGAIDDVIFKYRPRGHDRHVTCFMQLKHRETRHVTFQEILDFKYYNSYLEIEKKSRVSTSPALPKEPRNYQKNLFDNQADDCEFVFYTNSKLGPLDKVLKTDKDYHCVFQDMLNTGKSGDIFRFSSESLKSFFSWIPDFLNNTTVFTCQAQGKVLKHLIEDELKKVDPTNKFKCNMLLSKITHWWTSKSSDELTDSTLTSWMKDEVKVSNVEVKDLKPENNFRVRACALLFLRGVNSKVGVSIRLVDAQSSFGHIVYKYKLPGEDKHNTCFVQLRYELLNNELDLINTWMSSAYSKTLDVVKSEGFEFLIYSCFDAGEDIRRFEVQYVPGSHVSMFTSSGEERDVFRLNGTEILSRVTRFYSRCHVFCGLASEEQLNALIEDAIGKLLVDIGKAKGEVRDCFVKQMAIWWARKPSADVLTEGSSLWWDIALNASLRGDLRLMNISYSAEETDKFWRKLRDAKRLHVISADVELTCLKILETLERCCDNQYIFMEMQVLLKRGDELRIALSGAWCKILAVVCSQVTDDSSLKFAKLIQDTTIILISSFDNKLPPSLLDRCVDVNDSHDFYSLGDTSQKHLLERRVVFKGISDDVTTIETIMKDHDFKDLKSFASKYLRPYKCDLVVKHCLISDIPEYIPRSLSISTTIKVAALLKNQDDVIVVSNVDNDYLQRLLEPRNEKVDAYYYKTGCVNESNVYIVEEAAAGNRIRELRRITNNRVHWLRFNRENKSFHWIHSVGGLGTLRSYINIEEADDFHSDTLLDCRDNVVLLTAEPGMGKTTLMSHIALRLKEAQPNSWVVRLNLNEHSCLLDMFGSEGCASEHEFLATAMTSKIGPSLERRLLCRRLRQHERLVVLLDGFDEIAGYYKENGFKILKLISKSCLQLWVSTRQSMRKELEELLGTISYTLKPITRKEQKVLINKLWGETDLSNDRDQLIERLIDLLKQSFTDVESEFMGIPLQTVMVAQVYKSYGSNLEKLPPRINLLQLYEDFVNIKWDIFVSKYRVDISNTFVNYLLANERQRFDKNHARAAVVALCDDRDLARLHDKEIREKAAKFFDKFLEGETGIVDKVIDRKPMFLHRSFAEYFAARWLAEHFRSNTEFLAGKFFQGDFLVVRHIFDRLLARGCHLHEAVIDHHLPEELSVSDVRRPDAGGRTLLHLALLHLRPDAHGNCRLMRRLLVAGADLLARDDVLHMAPPSYAARLGRSTSASLLVAASNPVIPTSGEPLQDADCSFNKLESTVLDRTLDQKSASLTIQICALLYLRCFNRRIPFVLGTNVWGALSFGDIVLKYKPYDSWKTCFMQVLGRDKKRMYQVSDPQRFNSQYLKIMASMATTSNNELFSGPANNCELVVFSNAKIPEYLRVLPQDVEKDLFHASESEGKYQMHVSDVTGDLSDSFLTAFSVRNGMNEADVNEMLIKEMRMRRDPREMLSTLLTRLKHWWISSDELLTLNSTLLGHSLQHRHVTLVASIQDDVYFEKPDEDLHRHGKMESFPITMKYSKDKKFNATVANYRYNTKMLAFMYLQSLKLTASFFLAAELSAGGKFGDLVLNYKLDSSDPWKACFINVAHKLAADNSVVHLKDFQRRGHFYIDQYFKKYANIRRSMQENRQLKTCIINDFSDWCFVAYTNACASAELEASVDSSSDKIYEILSSGNPATNLSAKFPENSESMVVQELKNNTASSADCSVFLQRFTLMLGQADIVQLDAILDSAIASTLFTSPEDTVNLRENFLLGIQLCWNDGTIGLSADTRF